MRKKSIIGSIPITSIPNSWDNVDACKTFCPCDSLTDGYMVDVKGGAIIQAQANRSFTYNSTLKGVHSDAIYSDHKSSLISGSFGIIPDGYFSLLLMSGYVDEDTLAGPGAAERYIRNSIGPPDTGAEGTGSFGMADGNGHCIFITDTGEWDCWDAAQNSTAEKIYAAIGSNSHFFRYALARPDTQVLEEGTFRTDNGAVIFANDQQYGVSAPVGTNILGNGFRMCGHTSTGWARFDFPALMPNYLTLIKLQVLHWLAYPNNRIILPYWDQ